MKTYSIEDLYATAWMDAIANVGKALGMDYTEAVRDHFAYVEEVARRLKVRFDLNGEIV